MKKQLKLRDNYRYRALWGNYKSDKYKRKLTIISEIEDIIRDLWHPFISRKDLIELKGMIKRIMYSDGDEELPSFTKKQHSDYWDMHPRAFRQKWGDEL
jgi:hypothetical protein